MAEAETFRLAAGNNIRDDFLRKRRNPTFLHRNIRTAIDVHATMLAGSSTVSHNEAHLERSVWKPPSLEDISRIRGRRAIHIRPIAILAASRRTESSPVDDTTRHVKRNRRRTSIAVESIVLGRDKDGQLHPYKSNIDLKASLERDKPRTERVSLCTNPFRVYIDDLERPDSEYRVARSSRAVADSYSLSITIDFRSTEDVKELLTTLGVAIPKHMTGRWFADVRDLFRCSEARSFLALYANDTSSNRGSLGLDLEVQVDYEGYPGGSIIAASNIIQRELTSADAQRQRRAKKSKPSSAAVEITFIFTWQDAERSNDKIIYQELRCPHCNPQPHSYSSISDLQLHLKTFHVDNEYVHRKEKVIDGVQYWMFEVSVAKLTRARNSERHSGPKEVFKFTKPDRPYDLAKDLAGDDSWQTEALEVSTHIARNPRKTDKRGTKSMERPAAISGVDAEQIVEPRPKTKLEKRKYVAPKVKPGITLFRSLSKRPIVPGELLSESDDDVDMRWLSLRTERLLMEGPDIPEAAKQLRRRYDPFMRDERLSGDAHFEDTLVRFVTENVSWLQDEGLVSEMMKKITELREDDLISEGIFNQCVQLMDQKPLQQSRLKLKHPALAQLSGQPTPPITPDGSLRGASPASVGTSTTTSSSRTRGTRRTRSEARQKHEDAEMRDAPLLAPRPTKLPTPKPDSEPDTNLLPYNKCICGTTAISYTREPIVHCRGDLCTRRTFHIACVRQHWQDTSPKPRDRKWYCMFCKEMED